MEETYITRLRTEVEELNVKRINLEHFIWENNHFDELDKTRRHLLHQQLAFMAGYLTTIELRLEIAEQDE